MNDTNPSGSVINDKLYIQVIEIAIFVGLAVSLKRLAVGLFFGRQTFSNYGSELATVMHKMVLVSEVAGLANDIYSSRDEFAPSSMAPSKQSWDIGFRPVDIQMMVSPEGNEVHKPAFREESSRLLDLLERWEEPNRARQEQVSSARTNANVHQQQRIRSQQLTMQAPPEENDQHQRNSAVPSSSQLHGKKISILKCLRSL